LLSALFVVTQVHADNMNESEPEDSLRLNNPGSITKRLEEDAAPKEYLFQIPGVDGVMKPWYDFKSNLDKNHGVRSAFLIRLFIRRRATTTVPRMTLPALTST
jgi:hypothetical protein